MSATTTGLGLGTVQFGLPYGIANTGVSIDDGMVSEMLARARGLQIRMLDTAPQYGSSEARLGANDLSGVALFTKTPRLAGLDNADAANAVMASARQSLARLDVERLDGLLVHHAEDLLGPSGDSVHAALERLRADGLVGRIGVSVYDGKEIELLLTRYRLDVVQLPINVLDQRLKDGGQLAALAAAGVAVHARSVYLQGLLLLNDEAVPAQFSHFRPALARFRQAARDQRMTTHQAALGWLRDIGSIDIVLVGATDVAQLAETADAFRTAPLFDAAGLAQTDEQLLDPRRWAA